MESGMTVRELAKDRPHNMLIVCWDTNNKIGVIPPPADEKGEGMWERMWESAKTAMIKAVLSVKPCEGKEHYLVVGCEGDERPTAVVELKKEGPQGPGDVMDAFFQRKLHETMGYAMTGKTLFIFKPLGSS